MTETVLSGPHFPSSEPPECSLPPFVRERWDRGSGRGPYRGPGGSSAAAPVHSDPKPCVTAPEASARIQWHMPPGACTAAAQISVVPATDTISVVVEGPSTKV